MKSLAMFGFLPLLIGVALAGEPVEATVATNDVDLTALAKDPTVWPGEIRLMREYSLPVLVQGKEAGSVKLAMGTPLKLVQALGEQIRVVYGDSTNVIPVSVSDLGARVAKVWVARLTVGGVTYENVRWGAVTPSTVSIRHAAGIATIPLASLSPDLQKRFGHLRESQGLTL